MGRLLALSDGVFAIALTLLVLNLGLPRGLEGRRLDAAVDVLVDNLVAAAISFAVIGAMWLGHHSLWRKIRSADHRIMVLNLAFLGPIALVPFAAQVLSAYGDEDHPLAYIAYAGVLVTAGLMSIAMWVHAGHAGLIHPAVTGRERRYGYIRPLTLVVVFLLSMPIALVQPEWAAYSWISLAVVMPVAQRLVLREDADPSP